LALAVGIEGTDEMMEVEVCGPVAAPQLERQLQQECPPGLHIYRLSALPTGTAKPHVTSVTYEIQVPPEELASCQSAIEALREQPTMWIERPGNGKPVDLRADLVDLCLAGGVLRITQRVSPTASARPREILHALGISQLETKGHRLQRTAVRLADRTQPGVFPG
jgi:radical SAM-linked protein